MTKTHEQNWHASNVRFSVRDEAGNIKALVTTDDQTPEEAQAVLSLLAASPDMARALLEMYETPSNARGDVTISGEFMDRVGDILRKARVLP